MLFPLLFFDKEVMLFPLLFFDKEVMLFIPIIILW